MASQEQDKRIVLYPAYINAKRSVSQGRRIPADKACDDPNVLEMLDCCSYLKLPAEIEDKQYPRDWWLSRGRLRVTLFGPDGQPSNPEIATRREMMLRVADLVTRHPSRHGKKPGGGDGAGASGSGTSGGSKQTSSKKKGKKK